MGFLPRRVQGLRTSRRSPEIDGTDLIYKNYYHIGVAVGTDKASSCRGARLRHKSISDIEKGIADFGAAPAMASSRSTRCRAAPSHHQWRYLRFADVDADPERAAVGYPRHAQDPGAAMVVGGKIEVRR